MRKRNCQRHKFLRGLWGPSLFLWTWAAAGLGIAAPIILPANGIPESGARGPRSEAGQQAEAPKLKPDAKKAKEAYRRATEAERKQDWAAAYEAYSQAVEWQPDNRDYLMRREIAKGRLIQAKIDSAEKHALSGQLGDARKELLEASYLDPADRTIRERLAQLTALEPIKPQEQETSGQLVSEIRVAYQPGTRSFDFRGETQALYESIARQFGLDVAFDAELRPQRVRFQVKDVDFRTAMELAGNATHTFWRPLSSQIFFVADDTQQKRRQYEPLIVRTIALPASETPEQVTEISRLIREMTGILRVQVNTDNRTLTLRASPQAMAVASELIENLEKPSGELILEMEILEVDRNYARQIGLTPPQTAKTYMINSNLLGAGNSTAEIINLLEQIFGTPSSLSGLTPEQIATEVASGQLNPNSLLPPIIAFGGGQTTFFSTLPGTTGTLSRMLSLVHSGRRVLMRAEDGQPATFFVGERYPVSLGQYSSSLTSNINTTTITSQNFPITAITTGTAPAFVTAGDFNNDSKQDMVVANHGDNTVSMFLGNGDGTFTAPTTATFATGIGPVWIATGTFNLNSDKNLDLAVANKGANSVSILIGNGDGTFQPKVDIPTGTVPVSVVAGDFNGDGNPDLAVANQADNTISLFLGNGSGGFSAPTTVPALLRTGRSPTALAVASLHGATYANGQPILDLAVANQADNTVSIFLGNGDGSFKAPVSYATGVAPVYVATGDFNGDAIPDLAIANNTDNTVSVLFGQAGTTGTANGTFGARTDWEAGAGPTSIAVADYNLDGIQDLAVTDSGSDTISILFGLTGGAFNANYELSVGTDPVSIITADFNGDGRPDGAIANNASNTVSVILNLTSTETSSTGGLGTQFPGSEYLDLGLKIKATPRIHLNNEVTLDLHVELSNLAGQSFNSIPVISNDSLEQTVRLKENETTVLAGILQPSVSTALNGTPGISQVPGLGSVIGNNNVQESDRQLLVLITPRMVRLAERKDVSIYAGQGSGEGSSGGAGRFEPGIRVPQRPEPVLPQRPTRPQP